MTTSHLLWLHPPDEPAASIVLDPACAAFGIGRDADNAVVLARVLEKLDCRNTAEAIRYAVRRGLLDSLSGAGCSRVGLRPSIDCTAGAVAARAPLPQGRGGPRWCGLSLPGARA
jgi:hypothetical protein